MNNKTLLLCVIPGIASLLFSCGGEDPGQSKDIAAASSLSLHDGNKSYFTVDPKESLVEWNGSSLNGGHTGYISVSKGELLVDKGELAGGTVEVNMTTIEDEDHGRDNNLVNHLKDPDFFDVRNFPFSRITISGVGELIGDVQEITGDLVIKGITHPVTFPVKVELKDSIITASGKLVIDRTKWDVRYKSGKFFDNLKDEAISDSIEFSIRIVAKQVK